MAGCTILFIVLLQAAAPLLDAASLKNIDCRITPTVIPVDKTHHRFYPYFVELSRCAGSWRSIDPKITRCSAIEYEEIKLTVVSISTGQADHVTVLNHTKCGPECVPSPSDCDVRVQRWDGIRCRCSCLYQNGTPPDHVIERKEGFRWNKHLCQYVCNKPPRVCGRKKVWTRTACACECDASAKLSCERQNRPLNSQTCECQESAQVYHEHPGFFAYPHSHKLVAVIAVQGAFIVILIVAVVYFRRKSGNRTPLPGENINVPNRSAEGSSEQSA